MSLLFGWKKGRTGEYLWESLLVWGRAWRRGWKSSERKGRMWDRGGGGNGTDSCALLQGVSVGVPLSTQIPRIPRRMHRMHTLVGLGEP